MSRVDLVFLDELSDSSDSQDSLRQFLTDASLDELEDIITTSLEQSSNNAGLVLQDAVNELGNRLGFNIENGRYSGTQNEIGYDGLWNWPQSEDTDKPLVVETKKSTVHNINPSKQPGKYMSELAAKTEASEDDVFGLIVIGNGDIEPVVQSVRGLRKYREQIRVIKVNDLIELARLAQQESIPKAKISQLLFPIDTVYIGNLLSTINSIVSHQESDSTQSRLMRINADDLPGPPNDVVCGHPSSEESIEEIVKNYYAWGAVPNTTRDVDFVSLYTKDKGVEYVGEVEEVVSVAEFEDEYNVDFSSEEWYDASKIFFKFSTVYRLNNTIKLDDKARADKSINGSLPARQYFTLQELQSSETISELYGN